jgi:hypothetical protein
LALAIGMGWATRWHNKNLLPHDHLRRKAFFLLSLPINALRRENFNSNPRYRYRSDWFHQGHIPMGYTFREIVASDRLTGQMPWNRTANNTPARMVKLRLERVTGPRPVESWTVQWRSLQGVEGLVRKHDDHGHVVSMTTLSFTMPLSFRCRHSRRDTWESALS